MKVNSVDVGIREVRIGATNCKLNHLMQRVQTEGHGLGIGLQSCLLKSECCCIYFFILMSPWLLLVLYFMLLVNPAGSGS